MDLTEPHTLFEDLLTRIALPWPNHNSESASDLVLRRLLRSDAVLSYNESIF